MLGKTTYMCTLGLLVLSFGCTMCCHPYDNNGPVYDSCGQCASNVRAGSILADGEMQTTVEDQGMVQESTPNLQIRSHSAEDVEGATQLLSVTDRKVESSETLAESQPQANQPRTASQPTPAKRRY
jgi:hypothetical protein